MSIRVLLVDDHAIVRDGLRRVLQEAPDIEVVGEAADGRCAVELAEQLRPQVILMDISMPVLGGVEASRVIKERDLDAAIVFLSMHESEQYFLEALRCGAMGYVPKSAPGADVVESVRSASAGRVYLHPSVAQFLLQAVADGAAPAPPDASLASLTSRESEMLELIAEGLRTHEIAARLGISPHTVHRHRTNLMHKLGLHDRLAVLRYCIENGMMPAARG